MPFTHGITTLSIVPGRSEPAHRAEMSQQLLFGECYRVEEEKEEWLKVRTAHDDYPCWIDRKQHTPLDEEAFERIRGSERRALSLSFRAIDRKGHPFHLVAGSLLHDEASLPFTLRLEEQIPFGPGDPDPDQVVRTALKYLRTPYLWGGRTPFGVDCSGFVQMVMLLHGKPIPRDASDQVREGEDIQDLELSRKGDLAFFHNEEGKVVHVGILLDDGRIVHASGRVRIDPIDHKGILPEGRGEHSHVLNCLRRIL